LTDGHRHITVYTEVIILLQSSGSLTYFSFSLHIMTFLKMYNSVHLFITFTNIKHISHYQCWQPHFPYQCELSLQDSIC